MNVSSDVLIIFFTSPTVVYAKYYANLQNMSKEAPRPDSSTAVGTSGAAGTSDAAGADNDMEEGEEDEEEEFQEVEIEPGE